MCLSIVALLSLTIIVLLFYGRLLVEFNKSIFAGNFYQSFDTSNLNAYIFWNPYGQLGIPSLTSFSEVPFLVMNYIFFVLPGYVFSPSVVSKIFIVISTLIFGFSFYILTSEFSTSTFNRFIATIFFMFNPFMIEEYMAGNFNSFLFQALFLISLFLLVRSIRTKLFSPLILLLIGFIYIFTVGFNQLFLLGYPILLVFIGYASIFLAKFSSHGAFLKIFLKNTVFISITILIMGIPFILSTFFGPFNLSPNSAYALPLSVFKGYSQPFLNVLFLRVDFANQITMTASFFPHIIFLIWDYLYYAILLILLGSFIIFRDRRLAYLEIFVFISALIGAGTYGPIAFFNIFLYTHIAGYQAINGSYYWDWIPIDIFFSIMLLLFFNNFSGEYRNGVKNIHGPKHIEFVQYIYTAKSKKIARFILLVVAVTVIIMPILSQGYYKTGGFGIEQVAFPNNYKELPAILDSLANKNDSAVAFFNPASYFYFNNSSSNPQMNPIISAPTYREAGYPGYLGTITPSTQYFYWVYELFYRNETVNFPALMSVAGVRYFVNLFNTNSVGYSVPYSTNVNASQIMKYQLGVKLISETNSYAIYESEYNFSTASVVNNLSLILGSYGTLNTIASLGVNLAEIVPIFQSDLVPNEIPFILNHTSSIYISEYSGLYSLLFPYMNAQELNILDYVNNALGPQDSWVDSTTALGYPFAATSPNAFALTSGPNNLTMPFSVNKTGKLTLWVETYFSSSGSAISVNLNGLVIDTINTTANFTSAFNWVPIQIIDKKGNYDLTFHSRIGINAIRAAYVTYGNSSSINLTKLEKTLLDKNIKIIYALGPKEIKFTANGGHVGYGDASPSSPFLKYLFLGTNGSSAPYISLPQPFFKGDLFLNISVSDYTILSTSSSSKFGMISYSAGENYAGWIEIPVNQSSSIQPLNLYLKENDIWISNIILASSDSISGLNLHKFSIGALESEYVADNVKNSSNAVSKSSMITTVSESFSYTNATTYETLSLIDFNSTIPSWGKISISYDTVNTFVYFHNIFLEGNGNITVFDNLSRSFPAGTENSFQVFPTKVGLANTTYGGFSITINGVSDSGGFVINSTGQTGKSVGIENTLTGYRLSDTNSFLMLVRIGYYSNMRPSGKDIKLISAVGGMGTLVIESGGMRTAISISNSIYGLFMLGVYISASLMVSYIAMFIFWKYRKRLRIRKH